MRTFGQHPPLNLIFNCIGQRSSPVKIRIPDHSTLTASTDEHKTLYASIHNLASVTRKRTFAIRDSTITEAIETLTRPHLYHSALQCRPWNGSKSDSQAQSFRIEISPSRSNANSPHDTPHPADPPPRDPSRLYIPGWNTAQHRAMVLLAKTRYQTIDVLMHSVGQQQPR